MESKYELPPQPTFTPGVQDLDITPFPSSPFPDDIAKRMREYYDAVESHFRTAVIEGYVDSLPWYKKVFMWKVWHLRIVDIRMWSRV